MPMPTLPNILPLPAICKVEPEILLEAEMFEAVNAPTKVVAPVTLKVPPTAVLPVVRRVEDEILLEAEIIDAVNAPVKVVAPVTFKVPPTVTLLVAVTVVPNNPADELIAPEAVIVVVVIPLFAVSLPVIVEVPPIFSFPVMCKVEPEILLDAEIMEAVKAPLIIVFPFTSSKAAGDVVPMPTLLLPLTKTIMVFQLLKEVPAVPAATYSKPILLPPPIFMAHAVSLAA